MNISDTEIGLALGYHRNMDDLAKGAQALIVEKNLELNAADAKIARLKQELAIEKAHVAGLEAILDDVRPVAIETGHSVTALTGRTFDSGRPERKYHLSYNKAFDAMAKKLGFKSKGVRMQAK